MGSGPLIEIADYLSAEHRVGTRHCMTEHPPEATPAEPGSYQFSGQADATARNGRDHALENPCLVQLTSLIHHMERVRAEDCDPQIFTQPKPRRLCRPEK